MVAYNDNGFSNGSSISSESNGTPTSKIYPSQAKNGKLPLTATPTSLSPGGRSNTSSSSLSSTLSSVKWLGWAIAITSMYGFFSSYFISRKYMNKPVEVTHLDVFTNALHSSHHHTARRTSTDTGIDLIDTSLYTATENYVPGDSSTTTVIALATGYDLDTYQQFVGGLRKTGFKGKIIIGLHPDVSDEILQYMKFRDVTVKILQWTSCTYSKSEKEKKDIFKETTCAVPYPDIKIRWSRFPLARDWLVECTECTGPVLLMDARDSIFQLDPFGPGSPVVEGLQVFQEHVNMTTTNWLTDWPIKDCKGVQYNAPMLCSGTTVGTRAAMIKYLEIMYEEMKIWIEEPKCRFDINGDDQSIHNYLYYSGQLPFATSVVNRMGGIVNTIGHHAAQVKKRHVAKVMEEKGITSREAHLVPFEGYNDKTWINYPEGHIDHGITNDEGKFIEFDGSISRVVHQWDRFDWMYTHWLEKQDWASDKDVYGDFLRQQR
jgi:hypothetical protein